MINFENSDISNIVIHHVGNKFEGGGLTLSDGCFLPEDPDVVNLLKSYFLSAFKKDAYYNFLPYEEELMNNPVYGINIKKLDKACIVFNVNRDNGYKVCILDKTNTKEAIYWTTDFLGLEPAEASYFQTSNYLNLCKDFVKDIYNQENDVPRADQIDMLNRSINFFKDADVFSEERFKQEVVQEPEVINAFENFKCQYETDNNVELTDQFAISDFAVKDEKKYFKHVLKLDKNFHVYIHGEKKYIRKGYDPDRDMNYYVLYFRNEE